MKLTRESRPVARLWVQHFGMHIAASPISSGRSTKQLKSTRYPLPAVTALIRGRCRHLHAHAAAQKQSGKKQHAEPGAGLKAIWRAADQYSSFFGKRGEKPSTERKVQHAIT